MGGKRIYVNKVIDDVWIEQLLKTDPKKIAEKKKKELSSTWKAVRDIEKRAKELYSSENRRYVKEEFLRNEGLLSVRQAYEYLKENGLNLSFRAFGGRVERGSIPSIKVGRKRYIPIKVLNQLLKLHDEFYTVREAFNVYKKYDPKINFRAFIGRIEKGSIPSVKIGTKRLIPKVIVDALTEVKRNYLTVPETLELLRKEGINIKRNTLERRLDRRRVPFVKIGGKRYIPKEAVQELIEREKNR